MRRSDERILTTHAGSLPRPPHLVELLARRVAGAAVDPDELDVGVAAATRAVVPKQVAAGIDIIGNGEQGRESFFLYVQRRMSGFGGRSRRRLWQDGARYPSFLALREQILAGRTAVSNFEPPKVVGEVRYLDPRAIHEECEQFRRILDDTGARYVDAFVTAPSPGIIAAAVPNEHYDGDEAYVNALADALKVEYEAIVGHGFLLQIDGPDLAMERHVSFQDRPLGEFIGFVETVVTALNRSLAGVPRERVRLHVCWGNYEGPHDCDVPLDDVIGPILRADVGGFLLPMANPRHAHEYHVFERRRLADDQVLAVGVIDTTTNYIEHPEVVAERIERVAHALGDPTRVIAGTDCGFDTSAGMGRVAEEVVWAKLRALSDGARIASARLFG